MNPLNQLYPEINGVSPDWASLRLNIAIAAPGPLGAALGALPVIETEDIAAVNSSRAVEVGYKTGLSGGRRTGRGTGMETPEASITFWMAGAEKFKALLAASAPVRGGQAAISLVTFNITQMWTPPLSTAIFHRKIMGCRIIGDTVNSAMGTDLQQVEVPLSVMQIVDVINGREVSML